MVILYSKNCFSNCFKRPECFNVAKAVEKEEDEDEDDIFVNRNCMREDTSSEEE